MHCKVGSITFCKCNKYCSIKFYFIFLYETKYLIFCSWQFHKTAARLPTLNPGNTLKKNKKIQLLPT